jgi:hypothetical protein
MQVELRICEEARSRGERCGIRRLSRLLLECAPSSHCAEPQECALLYACAVSGAPRRSADSAERAASPSWTERLICPTLGMCPLGMGEARGSESWTLPKALL